MGLTVLDQNGVETPVIMGSYGIGVERVLCAAVELYSDEDGICLPVSIAPFEVVITPVKVTDGSLKEAADRLYRELKEAGVDVLYDDRDLSPGVKFKDADLIGVPFRVNIGRKLASGRLELVNRRTREVKEIDAASAAAEIRQAIEQARPQARH